MKSFVLIAFTLLLANIASAQIHEKLHVAIYYESLCPDSIRFINDQLKPNYEHLKDFIEIHFIPFGKSDSINNGEYFTCQHGPKECEGNLIQSCALNEIPGQQSVQVSFVACQMHYDVDPSGKVCSDLIGIDHSKVEHCISSGIGTDLQLQAETLTKQIAPKFVPTIVYNGQFNQILQDRSQDEFVNVVCELINNSAPVCVH